MRVQGSDPTDVIIPYQDVASFNIVGDLAEYGYEGEFLHYAGRSTAVVVPHEWRLPDGTTASVALAKKNTPAYK